MSQKELVNSFVEHHKQAHGGTITVKCTKCRTSYLVYMNQFAQGFNCSCGHHIKQSNKKESGVPKEYSVWCGLKVSPENKNPLGVCVSVHHTLEQAVDSARKIICQRHNSDVFIRREVKPTYDIYPKFGSIVHYEYFFSPTSLYDGSGVSIFLPDGTMLSWDERRTIYKRLDYNLRREREIDLAQREAEHREWEAMENGYSNWADYCRFDKEPR